MKAKRQSTKKFPSPEATQKRKTLKTIEKMLRDRGRRKRAEESSLSSGTDNSSEKEMFTSLNRSLLLTQQIMGVACLPNRLSQTAHKDKHKGLEASKIKDAMEKPSEAFKKVLGSPSSMGEEDLVI